MWTRSPCARKWADSPTERLVRGAAMWAARGREMGSRVEAAHGGEVPDDEADDAEPLDRLQMKEQSSSRARGARKEGAATTVPRHIELAEPRRKLVRSNSFVGTAVA